jgi:uncharacterized protein YndB with AHSA1/START domain
MPDGTTVTSTDPIVREIDIEAVPETVFEFFVDADKLTRWLAVEATLDPRPGGVCHQVHEGYRGSGPFHMRGEFVELDPPRWVVFTWGFEEPEIGAPLGGSTVEVTLSPSGAGTRVRLVHTGLSTEANRDASTGWTVMLDRLRAAVVGS